MRPNVVPSLLTLVLALSLVFVAAAGGAVQAPPAAMPAAGASAGPAAGTAAEAEGEVEAGAAQGAEAEQEAAAGAAPKAILSGVVRDGAGKPMPGAKVEVRSYHTSDIWMEGTADAQGHFRTGPLAPADYLVWVDAGDLLETKGEVLHLAAGEQVHDLVCPRHDIEGRVVSPAGVPMAGVQVLVTSLEATRSDLTGADGRFRFTVLDGWYQLTAQASEYPPVGLAEPVHVHGGTRKVEIRLRRDATIRGRITGVSPADLTHGAVRAFPPGGESEPRELRLEAGGRFTVDGAGPGDWGLEVEAAGGKICRQVVSVPPGEGTVVEVEVAFPPYYPVSGLVGDPLPRDVDTLSFDDWRQNLSLSTRRGADGHFSLGLPDGTYVVSAHRATDDGQRRMAKTPLVVAGAPAKGVVIHLDAAGSIAGHLFAAPEGQDDLAVWASQGELAQPADMDEAGRFRLTGLAPGPWEVTGWAGDGENMVSESVDVPANAAAPIVLDLAFHSGALTLSGRLTGFDPAEEYEIKAQRAGEAMQHGFTVDVAPDGTFSYPGLVAGVYLLRVVDTAVPETARWSFYTGTVRLPAAQPLALPVALPPQ